MRLFTCGFEENDLTNTVWTATGGTAPTIGSTSPHSGIYRLNTGNNAGQSYVRNAFTNRTSGHIFTRFNFSTASVAPSADFRIMANWSAALAPSLQVFLRTSGVLQINNSLTGTVANGTTVLSINTWYRVETDLLISDTVGNMTLKLYNDSGTLLETLGPTADEDTLPTGIAGAGFGKTGGTQTIILSYDDIAINDATDPGDGSQMTYPGLGKTYMLVPNSDVAITWEDDAGGTDNATFANIDGLPVAVDDTDYNAIDTLLDVADALGQEDRLGLTNLGAEVPADATITLADVYGRVGSGQTSAANMRFMLWDESGTLTNGPTCNANVATWKIVLSSEHLVYNATGKSKANFDSFNVGYEAITDVLALRPRRVSELWVNVEWTEATVTAALMVPSIQDSCEMIGMRNV